MEINCWDHVRVNLIELGNTEEAGNAPLGVPGDPSRHTGIWDSRLMGETTLNVAAPTSSVESWVAQRRGERSSLLTQ